MSSLNLSRRISRKMYTLFFRSLAIAGLIVVSANSPAFADPSPKMTFVQVERRHHSLVREAMRILFSEGDWNRARELLVQARNLSVETARGQFPYRSKEADFYWAWILCHTSGEQDEGRRLLDKTLKNDSWPTDVAYKIHLIQSTCGSKSTRQPPPTWYTEEERSFVVIQKGGKWSQPVHLHSRHLLHMESWHSRYISKDKIRERFKSYNLIESQPFLVVGPFKEKYLKELSDTVLEPYFKYISQILDIEYDWGTIFVFVAPDHEQFYSITNWLYRVDPEDRIPVKLAIAYSDIPNQTMLAICGTEASNCTSFAHELFHLLNSKVFKNTPWWFYEGMAELLESGDLHFGEFYPRRGWRVEDAKMNKLDMKSFVELLSISKNDPATYGRPVDEIAMARARFFCYYLKDKGALLPIYDELRRRDWGKIANDTGGIEVIEKILKKPIKAVSADFKQWFAKVVLPQPGTHGP